MVNRTQRYEATAIQNDIVLVSTAARKFKMTQLNENDIKNKPNASLEIKKNRPCIIIEMDRICDFQIDCTYRPPRSLRLVSSQ